MQTLIDFQEDYGLKGDEEDGEDEEEDQDEDEDGGSETADGSDSE